MTEQMEKSFQILQPNGALQPENRYILSEKDLQTLYFTINQTRQFDLKAIALQRTGRLRTFPSSYGQEAIFATCGLLMHADDVYCPYYRDQAALMQRGMSMTALLQYWGGDERGSSQPSQGKDFPICIPIASQCLHAVGAAYAMQYQHKKQAVVTTIGEGGTSKGDFYEALNMAALHQLPVVFIVNNNQWAISTPAAQQTATVQFADKAKAANIDAYRIDGNDVFILHKTIKHALEKAYAQNGPTLIEAVTYRLCDHTTADDASRYDNAQQKYVAEQLEPLIRLRNYLYQQNWWSDEQELSMQQRIQQSIDEATAAYLDMPAIQAQEIMTHLFQNAPASIVAQQRELEQMHDYD